MKPRDRLRVAFGNIAALRDAGHRAGRAMVSHNGSSATTHKSQSFTYRCPGQPHVRAHDGSRRSGTSRVSRPPRLLPRSCRDALPTSIPAGVTTTGSSSFETRHWIPWPSASSLTRSYHTTIFSSLPLSLLNSSPFNPNHLYPPSSLYYFTYHSFHQTQSSFLLSITTLFLYSFLSPPYLHYSRSSSTHNTLIPLLHPIFYSVPSVFVVCTS
jgi:hypothetical protein